MRVFCFIINLNSHTIKSTGGTITIESGATLNPYICLKTGSTINGLYPSINSALAAASSGQTIEVYGAHTLVNNLIIPSGCNLQN